MKTKLVPEDELDYCGNCGSWHKRSYFGSCQNNKERYVEAEEHLFVPAADFDFVDQKVKVNSHQHFNHPQNHDADDTS